MIPVVILVVVLATPTFSLPLSTEDFITTGTQGPEAIIGSTKYINPQVETGEKSQTEGLFQTSVETKEGSFTEASVAKIGVKDVPTGVIQHAEKIENQSYSESGQIIQQVTPGVYSDASAQYSGVKAPPQGIEVPFTSHQHSDNYPQDTPVTKTDQAEHNRLSHSENPVLLPMQPLTIVPVNQVGELLQPVIVPAEALTAGRLIIMTINPTQKRSFQDVSVIAEKELPYQQVIQPAPYSSETVQEVQQTVPVYVQPVEKQQIETGAPTSTPVEYQPNHVASVKEQVVQNINVVQQAVEPVQNYGPAQPVPQVYNVHPNIQPVVNDYIEKQVPQQFTGYTPAESSAPQQPTDNVQRPIEREYQQEVQTSNQPQDDKVAPSNHPYHQSALKQSSDPSYKPQQAMIDQPTNERQASFQQGGYISVQNQPPVQQEYKAQPENLHSYVLMESQPVQQKVSSGHPEYEENYIPVQPQLVEETHAVYQPGVKQTQTIGNFQNPDVHPNESTQQQQVSNVQPFVSNQAEVRPEYREQVPQEVQKASHQQVVGGVQPQAAVNYTSQQVYNFSEKISQNPSTQQSSLITSCHQ